MVVAPYQRASPGPPTAVMRPVIPKPRSLDPVPQHRLPAFKQSPAPFATGFDGRPELKVRLQEVPKSWGTLQIYKHFASFGNIDVIEIFDEAGRSSNNAFMVFRPAPAAVPWANRYLPVLDEGNTRSIFCKILDEDRGKTFRTGDDPPCPPVEGPLCELNAGILQQEDDMRLLFTAKPIPSTPLQVIAKLEHSELQIHFGMQIPEPTAAITSTAPQPRQYRLHINFAQIKHAVDLSHGFKHALLITTEKPPLLFRKASNTGATHSPEKLFWRERQTWYRQTGIDAHAKNSSAATQLQKEHAVLDIGRWLTYRLEFGESPTGCKAHEGIGRVLLDHNVQIVQMAHAKFTFGDAQELWSWAREDSALNGAGELSGLHVMSTPSLDFKVRYELEVCLSNGVLNEANIDATFIEELALCDPERMQRVLQKISDENKRIFQPRDIFRLQGQVSVIPKRIPKYCAMVAAAVVTPSTIYFTTPVMETSNRVIRQYQAFGDRFLRVKFTDERYRGKIMAGDDNTMAEILTHVHRTMRNGIKVGDRHYHFLAFGNSQFREHGAYFFAPTSTVTPAQMRQWMGDFKDIEVVAKYAARVGQCFSTTRAVPYSVTVVPIEDIQRNNYCFTDGVGKISRLLAVMIADHYNLPHTADDYPSVFQFRLGGYKGVLAVDPTLEDRSIHLRPSQKKFPAKYQGLEICRISQYSSANLNVQIILVLDSLGVDKWAFKELMKRTLDDLLTAMTDERKATDQLCRNIDFSQTTLILADMIYDGFMSEQEPFLVSCLRLWRSWMLKYLKEKARIPVEQGAFVLGCVDETKTLRGHFDSLHASDVTLDQARLPEIFLQISTPGKMNRYQVIEGVCILARNPSLHPGDIRVVRAVDVPKLHHLSNCVVLPQTGDRDLANMCSGGDLDGDDYLVIWDADLIPKEWSHPPMSYVAPEPKKKESGVPTVEDMMAFYVQHMKHDNLGRIAMAHRYHADKSAHYKKNVDVPGYGVKEQSCVELAQLHSQAVDFAKTGVAAVFPRKLRVKEYPHWAELKSKPCYKSSSILGQLYDMVDRVEFVPAWELEPDGRILEAHERCIRELRERMLLAGADKKDADHVPGPNQLSEKMFLDAAEIKQQYDAAIRRIMAQYGIKSEFEAWTTFVLVHNNELNDYKFAETLGESISGLKECYQELCYERAGTTAGERDWLKMAPFISAMYAVTAQEVKRWRSETQALNASDSMLKRGHPFISFPWIFARELGYIAKGRTPGVGAVPSIRTTAHVRQPKKPEIFLRDDACLPDLEVINPEGEKTVHGGDLFDLHNRDASNAPTPAGSQQGPHRAGAPMPLTEGATHVQDDAHPAAASDAKAAADGHGDNTGGSIVNEATSSDKAVSRGGLRAPVHAASNDHTDHAEEEEATAVEVFIERSEKPSALDRLVELAGL